MRFLRLRKFFRVWRGLRAFVYLDMGVTRGEAPGPELKIRAQARQIEQLKARLSKRDQQEAAWEAGIPSEMAYWRKWFTAKKPLYSGHFEDYKERLNPGQPLVDDVIEHLDAPPGATVSILDVGAGPLTMVGKRWDQREVRITAVDPLADRYEHLLTEFGITPPVRTQLGAAERLNELFPPDYFDLVYSHNALDHSYDPLLGIRQMLRVVKSGCYVLLRHFVNEAEEQDYKGFHQWNFSANTGCFVIWNRETSLCINDLLGHEAEITVAEGPNKANSTDFLVSLRKQTS